MKRIFRMILPVLALVPCAMAQQPGLSADWDIRAILKEISAHAGRLVPLLDQADPSAWVQKGAPDAYIVQWKSLKEQAQALSGDALELSKDPEKLAPALQTFFRMQSIEFMVGSYAEGMRRYQNPAQANQLIALAAENGANRGRFQHYIVELAAQKEQEYQIMDHEAQRCRGMPSREAPASKGKTGRR